MENTIYICGPMRGQPEHNFPAFNAAAARFRAAGWHVVSPVEVGEIFGNDPSVPGSQYLRADVIEIANRCGAIALLPGWEKSVGARCEVAVSLTIGLRFHCALTMAAIPAPARVTVNGGYEKPVGAIDTLDSLAAECAEWSNETFGQSTPSSKAEHLRREAVELCQDPTDTEEMADIFMLLSHLAYGADLARAVRAKLEKNRLRKWGKPDAQGVVEHIESGAT